MGYKVSQIVTRAYGEFIGVHAFPSFMFSGSISETAKVVLFNRYVKEIERKENPDIIIIGIPGGIMPFNKEFTNKFGILAYEVSQAVTPDAAVLSTLYEDYKPEYFQMIASSVKYKLGFDIDCFNLSSTQFDWLRSKEVKKMLYMTLDGKFIDKKKQIYDGMEAPVYNIFNAEDSLKMASLLINRLSDYGAIQCV